MNEHKIINMVGKTFGYWTVIGISEKRGGAKSRWWNCRCICGKEMAVEGCRLRRGSSKSCRCKSQEFRLEKRMTHGETRGHRATKEYAAWQAMINRCTKPKTKHFHNYGGRGITICKRWLESYENFIADMDRAPTEKHSLDRINNNGNYEPSNCRWATAKEQGNNRRTNINIEYNGLMMTISQWAIYLKCKRSFISGFFKKGKSFDWIYEKIKDEQAKAA